MENRKFRIQLVAKGDFSDGIEEQTPGIRVFR